jgi:hypothetical protein
VVSVLDVLEGALSPEQVMKMELPFVMDLVRAKIRLEESKSKAQRAAREMEKLNKKGQIY